MNASQLVAIQVLLDNAAFAALMVATALYWLAAAFRRVPLLHELGTGASAVALLSVTGLLTARWIETDHFPVSNLYESLFFLCWCVLAVHIAAEAFARQRLVGVFTLPVALGMVAFSSLTLSPAMKAGGPLVPALKSNWLMMHVSVMILSYGALMVGSLVSIAFLIVTWKQKDPELRGSSVGTGGFQKAEYTDSESTPPAGSMLSSLGVGGSETTVTLTSATATAGTALRRSNLAETLDNLSYRLIGLGFPLITVGIIAGAVWANEAWGSYWSWDPKETWSLITWFIFAAYLHARITRGWQGRRPATLAAVGFVSVWITYLGVNFLAQGLHSYGWLSGN
ncbi:c-type cytochrome biogenesis protein CcsB [Gloeobacter violaceus]|uniref:Cytochrome c biogenesis protein CcsA n=1 Tax=Gloeobacter violaceus (strain ATCC 29082 / PCC 7421) TaxID=251221 RepID=CCSA_GLOVI|nr:c-type cytochrome biogenesis protein CcsB [Gloeobacter violaceus]Q7NJ10.1 RecName: Full=Cytochrome c biogenesis protein CcsA [Gloeobacter violaceus PCC 7421]BAC89963.1 c-type cytochrome biogenesis protein [Gloeobacter violaceus PCC 7421]